MLGCGWMAILSFFPHTFEFDQLPGRRPCSIFGTFKQGMLMYSVFLPSLTVLVVSSLFRWVSPFFYTSLTRMVKQILECRKWSTRFYWTYPFFFILFIYYLFTVLPYHVLRRWQSLFSFQTCPGKRSNNRLNELLQDLDKAHDVSLFGQHPGIPFSIFPQSLITILPFSFVLTYSFIPSCHVIIIYLISIHSPGGSSDPLGAPANAPFEVLSQCAYILMDWLTLPPVRFAEDQLPFIVAPCFVDSLSTPRLYPLAWWVLVPVLCAISFML